MILTGGLYAQSPALTADQVIVRAIDAMGGAANLAKVESLKLNARMKFGKGEYQSLTVIAKRPSLFRLELIVGSDRITQVYDGAIGWQSVAGEHKQDPTVLTGESLAHLIDQAANVIGGPLLDIEMRHNAVEMVGKETVKGVECIKLKVTLGTGDTMDLFIDPANFLTIQEELPMKMEGKGSVIQETVGNYRKFGSILMACLFVTREKGGEDSQFLEIDSVETNPAAEDSLFKMPAKN
jgi:hypothetical protein